MQKPKFFPTKKAYPRKISNTRSAILGRLRYWTKKFPERGPVCIAAASQRLYRDTVWRETQKEKRREYRQINKEKIRRSNLEYQRENRDKTRRWVRESYARNKKKSRARGKIYYEKNKDTIRAKQANGRSKTKGGGNLQIMKVLYDASRRITKCTGIKFEIDHIIPVSKGGPHHHRNLQILPGTINRRKFTRIGYQCF